MFELIANRTRERSSHRSWRQIVVGAGTLCVVLSASLVAQAAAEFRGVRLNVSDPAAAAHWYCDHMGGTLVSPTSAGRDAAGVDHDRVRAVRYGKTTLEFHPTQGKEPVAGSVGSGIDHLGFGYADLDREMQRFAATGVRLCRASNRRGRFAMPSSETAGGR